MVNCCNRDNLNNPCDEGTGLTGPTGATGPAGAVGPTGPTGAGVQCDINNNLITGGSTYSAGSSNTIYGCEALRNTALSTANNNTAIGRLALDVPNVSGCVGGVAVGYQAGQAGANNNIVAIGNSAGQTNQGTGSVAIGNLAGGIEQGINCVAIGLNAGGVTQGNGGVAIGNNAGYIDQKNNAVAIGQRAGEQTQGLRAVAIGADAGNINQGIRGISIGYLAGELNQSLDSVAIGTQAGQTNQGSNCIAIGNLAGQTNQANNSICLNASGVAVSPVTQGLYARPLRNITNSNTLYYNPSTYEISYGVFSSPLARYQTNPILQLVPYTMPTSGNIVYQAVLQNNNGFTLGGANTLVQFNNLGLYFVSVTISGSMSSASRYNINLAFGSSPFTTLGSAFTSTDASGNATLSLSAMVNVTALPQSLQLISVRLAGTGNWTISDQPYFRYNIFRIA